MIPRRKTVSYRGMFRDIFSAVLKGKFIKGREIEEFEKKFADYIGVKHAITVSSARFGMELLLRSLDLDRGDEIILPAYTFYALPQIVVDMGLKPVFVDIRQSDFGLDPALIEEKITGRTKVIMAAHLFGMVSDISEIKKIADKHGLKLIEDCAHSAGAEYGPGRKAGTCGIGGFFSFDTHKPINTLGGGMVVTDSDKIAESVRKYLSRYSYSGKKVFFKIFFNYAEGFALSGLFNFFTIKLIHNEKIAGFIKIIYRKVRARSADPRFLFSNVQAILGSKQLERLDETIQKRKGIAKVYIDDIKTALSGLFEDNRGYLSKAGEKIDLFNYHIFLCFVILARDAKNISKKLSGLGVDSAAGENVVENCGRLYSPSNRYPVTEFVMERALELPMFTGLTEKDIQFIVNRLKAVSLFVK